LELLDASTGLAGGLAALDAITTGPSEEVNDVDDAALSADEETIGLDEALPEFEAVADEIWMSVLDAMVDDEAELLSTPIVLVWSILEELLLAISCCDELGEGEAKREELEEDTSP